MDILFVQLVIFHVTKTLIFLNLKKRKIVIEKKDLNEILELMIKFMRQDL